VRLQGHSKFLQKHGKSASEAGQNNCSPWFCPICRAKARQRRVRWPVRQRSLSADLIFWFFCIKTKEQSQPAAIERADDS
jgi:hypothetical protein